jgi:hypothetical protein
VKERDDVFDLNEPADPIYSLNKRGKKIYAKLKKKQAERPPPA